MLKQYKYDGPYGSPAWLQQPVFIQSFEQDDLVYLSTKTCIPLVQLLDSPGFVTPDRNKTYEQMIEDASLDEIASYATGAGPWKVRGHQVLGFRSGA
jgi:glycerophosphoryl diester phosphodiesterase